VKAKNAHECWRRVDGNSRLLKPIFGLKFADGLKVAAKPVDRQPASAAA
jgi:putative transposase